MTTLANILEQIPNVNFSIEVSEEIDEEGKGNNLGLYHVAIEYSSNYWFFGIPHWLKINDVLRKLKYLVIKDLSEYLDLSYGVKVNIHKEIVGGLEEVCVGKVAFILNKSPVSELVGCFWEYRNELVGKHSKWCYNGSSEPSYEMHTKNMCHYFSYRRQVSL